MKLYLVLAAALWPAGLYAAPLTLVLTPGNMLAQTHSRAMFLGVTGTFRQLAGTLNFDPEQKTCHIDVTFQVESLALPNALIRSQTMSPAFLDPAQYPTQHYVGDCQGNMLAGQLTMRGQTHSFNMAITYQTSGSTLAGIHTEGTLNRYNWGLTCLTVTVGKMIRVTNDITLGGGLGK